LSGRSVGADRRAERLLAGFRVDAEVALLGVGFPCDLLAVGPASRQEAVDLGAVQGGLTVDPQALGDKFL